MDEQLNYIFADLNEQQKNIVKSSSNLIVTACPGSGKTRVLTRKLAFTALSNMESRKKIIAITYTNRAAEEIKDRLDLLNIESSAIWAGTIHQFCLEFIIRPYAMWIPRLSKGFKIIDEYVREKYIKQISSELKVEIAWYDIPKIKTALNADMRIIEARYKNIVEKYHDMIKVNREIDFDLILNFSIHILRNHPIASTNLAGIIRSVYVDEYQDTHEIQYEIIGLLAKNSKKINLLFVGDTDQAIYGNIGGVAKSFDELETITGLNFEVATLSGCYRSTQRIIDYYSHFQSDSYKIQSLSSNAPLIGTICLNTTTSKENIYSTISSIIQQKIVNGVPQEEICVMAPRWDLLYPLSKNLRKLLPNISFDAPNMSPIKVDDLSIFYKLAKLIFTESGKKVTMRKRMATEILNILSNDFGIRVQSHIDCFWVLQKINSTIPEVSSGLEYYSHVVMKFFHGCGIERNDYPVIFEQFDDFIEKAKSRVERYEDISDELDSYFKMFRSKYGVVVTTCHGVKGEEYDTVISFGVLQGMIPHWDVIINSRASVSADEARKMMYVIASRAKESLYLFAEQGRQTNSGNNYVVTELLGRYDYSYDNLS